MKTTHKGSSFQGAEGRRQPGACPNCGAVAPGAGGQPWHSPASRKTSHFWSTRESCELQLTQHQQAQLVPWRRGWPCRLPGLSGTPSWQLLFSSCMPETSKQWTGVNEKQQAAAGLRCTLPAQQDPALLRLFLHMQVCENLLDFPSDPAHKGSP